MYGLTTQRYSELVLGMRSAYRSNQNMIEWSKTDFLSPEEASRASVRELIIRLAYDMQAGSYVRAAAEQAERYERWFQQMVESIEPWVPEGSFSLLEVGVGEATTLNGVLSKLKRKPHQSLGIDISFARLEVAADFLRRNAQSALLAVASLFRMPFSDSSIDVVYTSHSLEPNGGREHEAIAELLRVSRRYVVMVEPDFESAPAAARARMAHHGYVTGLEAAAKSAGAQVVFRENMEFSLNPMNPSGLWVLEKDGGEQRREADHAAPELAFVCPATGRPLSSSGDGLLVTEDGVSYPVPMNVPLLTLENMFLRPAGRNPLN